MFNWKKKDRNILTKKEMVKALKGQNLSPARLAMLPEEIQYYPEDRSHSLWIGMVLSAKTSHKVGMIYGEETLRREIAENWQKMLAAGFTKRQIERLVSLQMFWQYDLTEFSHIAILYLINSQMEFNLMPRPVLQPLVTPTR